MSKAILQVLKDVRPPIEKRFIPSFQVPVTPCTMHEFLNDLEEAHEQGRKMLVDNINVDILWYAQRDAEYRHALNRLTDIILVDGAPIRWLAKRAGVNVPERMALTDVVPRLMQLATMREYSVFILGASPQTVSLAKKRLYEKNMLPHTVTCWSKPRHNLEDPNVNREVLKAISETKPDILFVALGSPFQTLWISRNWSSLPDCIIVPVGGAFDFMAGAVGRAPAWMQQIGLEWVYRLLMDRQKRNRSLFQRYILTDLPFALKLLIRTYAKRARTRWIQGERNADEERTLVRDEGEYRNDEVDARSGAFCVSPMIQSTRNNTLLSGEQI